MKRILTSLAAAALVAVFAAPASALTVQQVDQAMDVRIDMLTSEIDDLKSQPGSNRGQQNAEIRKLQARVKQIEAQQRLLGKSKNKEKQLSDLVARFDLDIVSPH